MKPQIHALSVTMGAILLSGCMAMETEQVAVTRAAVAPGLVTQSQAILRELLKDPESAKFRRTVTYRSVRGDQIVCGEYDARNSFGGYTGYDQYYFRFRDGALTRHLIDTSQNSYFKPAAQACAAAASGQMPLRVDPED